ALVKTDEQEVINFLLTTEIIPLCLRIMESGSELSKTVATFILQKILLDDTGLAYICQTYERFSHVAMILGKMVLQLSKEPSARLLKHVVRCYLRLSDNPRLIALQGRMQDAETQEQAGGKRHPGKQPDEMRAKTVVFHTDTDQNEKQ
ncbi:hypothetical protein STEG23_027334, partial [Scotinomys teguina]